LLEHEVGDRTVGILLERHRSGQTKTQPRSIEAGHAPRNVGFVTSPGIIKGGAALQAKRDLAPDHTHSSDQFVRPSPTACDRHIIFYLSHAIIVHETAYKDVGVGPIELLVTKSLARRGDLKTSTFRVVQDRREDTRGVKLRQTQPIDGSVHSYQCRRTQI